VTQLAAALESDSIKKFIISVPEEATIAPGGGPLSTSVKKAVKEAIARVKEIKAEGSLIHREEPKLLGELFWVKLKGFPWWPAELCEDNGSKGPKPQADMKLIKFFADANYGFLEDKEMRPFTGEVAYRPPDGPAPKDQVKKAMAQARKRLKELGGEVPPPPKSARESSKTAKPKGKTKATTKEKAPAKAKAPPKKKPRLPKLGGAGHLLNKMCWARIQGFPWWPAEFAVPLGADMAVIAEPPGYRFVFFYGTNDIQFVAEADLRPFDQDHLEAPAGGKKASKGSINALTKAKARLQEIMNAGGPPPSPEKVGAEEAEADEFAQMFSSKSEKEEDDDETVTEDDETEEEEIN